jgi:hypothetical protein
VKTVVSKDSDNYIPLSLKANDGMRYIKKNNWRGYP